MSADITVFLVYIPLAKRFFQIETSQTFMIAIIGAIVTILIIFVGYFIILIFAPYI
ncbi:MAG: hypothetical protein ACFFCJ_03595 [Promethearchaeota archaeon]